MVATGVRVLRGMVGGVAMLCVSALAEDARPEFRVAPDFFVRPIPSAAQPPALDRVVLRVNGLPVTQKEWSREIQTRLRAVNQPIPPEHQEAAMRQIQEQAVEALVIRKLFLAEADREKIVFSDKRITQEIARIQAELPPNVQMEDALREQGLTLPEFRADLLAQLKTQRLLETRVTPAPVADADVAGFYREHPGEFRLPESVQVRHILLKTEATDSASARRKKKGEAEALLRLLSRGDDFAKLAESRSDCPSRAQGGLLGTFVRGQLIPTLEEAAFGREVGKVGPVVETPAGYHLLLADRKNPAREVSLEEAKPQIRAYLEGQRQQEALNRFVETLRKNAVIESGSR